MEDALYKHMLWILTSIDIRKSYADVPSTKKQDEQNHKVEEEE